MIVAIYLIICHHNFSKKVLTLFYFYFFIIGELFIDSFVINANPESKILISLTASSLNKYNKNYSLFVSGREKYENLFVSFIVNCMYDG